MPAAASFEVKGRFEARLPPCLAKVVDALRAVPVAQAREEVGEGRARSHFEDLNALALRLEQFHEFGRQGHHAPGAALGGAGVEAQCAGVQVYVPPMKCQNFPLHAQPKA